MISSDLPPKEDCPSIIETVQKPGENWAKFINCFEAPELPGRNNSLATIVVSSPAASDVGTSTTFTAISNSTNTGTSSSSTTTT